MYNGLITLVSDVLIIQLGFSNDLLYNIYVKENNHENDRVLNYKLSILELSQTSINVSKACRKRVISKTRFYEYKRRFQTQDLEELKNLPPIHKNHSFTTPPEIVEEIIVLSFEHSTWG